MTRVLLNISVLVVVLAIRTTTPADAWPGVIRAETYACTSWAAAHEYTMQSLTPKGGQINKNCPIRLPQGAKVEVVNEDDDGYAVVTHRGKTWWVDDARVGDLGLRVGHFRFWQILLQKSFCSMGLKFSKP